MFTNHLPTSQKLRYISITMSLMLNIEINAVCFENYIKPINTLCGQNAKLLNFKVLGRTTYSYHFVSWG
jgi:hypothetical protein